MLFFASCGSEFKLAKQFVSQSPEVQMAVYFPEKAQVSLIQDEDSTYTQVLDSVNQDLFLDIMYAAYADELKRYNINVYIPDDPNAIQVDSVHWLVVLSKVEIQGLYTEYVDEFYDIVNDYVYSFKLNTVNVASWFDVNDGEWHPTLFDEYNLTDDFKSYVARNKTEGLQYHYNITPLVTKDVYDYAVFLGKRYAAFTNDYMMNRFVETQMETQRQMPRFKLRWDPYENRCLFQLEGEGFIQITDDSQGS